MLPNMREFYFFDAAPHGLYGDFLFLCQKDPGILRDMKALSDLRFHKVMEFLVVV